MPITPDALVADIATEQPATIAVFQRHHIDFCCGGKVPLAEACHTQGVDTTAVLDDLLSAVSPDHEPTSWSDVGLSTLIDHIQRRYHEPLREELPRLDAMLARVVSRHGDRYGEMLEPLQETFAALQAELLAHMEKEDRVLFPAIRAIEAGTNADPAARAWMLQPMHVMEQEHADAGAGLARMRELTDAYTVPAGACPTFRGLFFGLAQLETDMHVHIHLENNVLFPRAAAL